MKFGKIRASSRSTHLFGMLKASTGIDSVAWARISISLSLRQTGVPNPDEYNRDGTEFVPSVLFAADEDLYLALVASRLQKDGLDPGMYLDEMTRAHLNRGAISLKQRVGDLSDIYGFMREMGIGNYDRRVGD